MLSSIRTATFVLLATRVVYADEAPQLVESGSRDNSNQCDCYLVSGADSGFFQYHRFWDFRSIPNDDDGNDFTTAPPLLTSSDNAGGQNTTSPYFNTTLFMNDWDIQDGVLRPDALVPTVNSAQNIFISRQPGSDGMDSTYLTLRAYRLPDFASSVEVDSNQRNVLHSSIRARMRVVPNFSNNSIPFVSGGAAADNIDGLNQTHPVAPGAVLGFFTWESDTQESDIEILTSDPVTNIRYSNQPDYDTKTDTDIPGASTNAVLPNNIIWTEWHDHRIDWYDGISRWYVDGELVLEKTMNVPTKPSGLIFNLWSDGGQWSGNMTIGAQVIAGIEWIEMAFNISGNNPTSDKKRDTGATCNVGCNVDGVQNVGYPQVAFNATSSSNDGTTLKASMLASSIVVMGLAVFGL